MPPFKHLKKSEPGYSVKQYAFQHAIIAACMDGEQYNMIFMILKVLKRNVHTQEGCRIAACFMLI